VAATDDRGFLIYGTIYDNPDGIPEYDIYIRKLTREEIIITTEVRDMVSTTSTVKIFPLPAQNIINVQMPCSVEESCCSIFEISGCLVYKKRFQENGNLISIDIRNLKKGVYVISFQFPDQREFSSKFIKN